MLSLLLTLVQTLSGFSQYECDICGWPYRTGVNSQGKCYLIREGLQGGLEAGCYTWCDAWARQSGVSTPSTPVLTFWHDAGGAICKCQRLERSGEVGYNTRPTASCDWAYSDDVQSYYDSVALSKRNDDKNTLNYIHPPPDVQNYKSFMDQVRAIDSKHRALPGATAGYTVCGPSENPPGYGIIISSYVDNGDYYNQINDLIPLPPGKSCAEFMYSGFLDTKVDFLAADLSRKDTGLKRINDAIDAVQASIGSNNANIMDELGKIRSKPSGGGANLGPVFDTLSNYQNSQSRRLQLMDSSLASSIADLSQDFSKTLSESLDKLKRSLDSSSGGGSDLSGLREAIDSTNMHLKTGFKHNIDSLGSVNKSIRNLTDSLMSPGSPFGRMADSMGLVSRRISDMDSQMRENRAFDRAAESLAYDKVMDSLRVPAAERQQVEQGIQQAQGIAISGEANVQNLTNSLKGWQNLPGVCSDAPYWEIDLTGSHLGVLKIDLNQYPWVPKFSRLGMRFIGIMAGLFLVMKALELLGYNNAKKES